MVRVRWYGIHGRCGFSSALANERLSNLVGALYKLSAAAARSELGCPALSRSSINPVPNYLFARTAATVCAYYHAAVKVSGGRLTQALGT